MDSVALKKNDKKYLVIIGILSVVIPLVVALLFKYSSGALSGWDVSSLPKINALLNTGAAIMLIGGLISIKNQRPDWHRNFMFAAFTFSALFLVFYVTYHFATESTLFGDADHNGVVDDAELIAVGSMRAVYFVILLTHILLAMVVVPLVLLSIYFAISGQLPRHKKIVKWAYPIWLYVAVTGPVIYLMISPYYAH